MLIYPIASNLYVGLIRDPKCGGGHIAYNSNRVALLNHLLSKIS